MNDKILISKEEYTSLNERVKKLAVEKSYLQLTTDLMSKMSAVSGLENTIQNLLQIILDNIGGSNLHIYYMIDDEMYYADVFGITKKVEHIEDESVRKVFATKEFLELQSDFQNTKLLETEFTKAYTWVFPLQVGVDLIGVFKIEDLIAAARDLRFHLPTFFGYAAHILKNEILGHTKLKTAFDQLSEENILRKKAEEELRKINEDLENRVEERTVKLRQVNLQLEKELAERMWAEGSLQKSEARFRRTLEDMLEGCMIIGFDWTYLYLNETAARHGQNKRENLIGRTMLEGYPDVEKSAVFDHYRNCMEKRIPQRFEESFTFADGTTTWYAFSIEPIPEGIFVLSIDITNRKKAEEYLRKEAVRENVLLELYEKAPQLSEKQLYDYALEHAVKLTDSAIGFFHLVSDDQKNIILTTWNDEALKNCTAVYDTQYPIDTTGNWADCVRLKRPVIYNDFPNSPNRKGLPEGHSPVRRFMSIPVMEDDKVSIIFGVGNKIEEYDNHDVAHVQLIANELQKIIKQRHADVALKEQYSTLHSIINSTDALIFSVDRQYRYTTFNKAHAAVMKAIYGAEIEINHSVLDYMTVPEDQKKARSNIDLALAGEPQVDESYSGEEKFSRLYFEVSHNPVLAEDGTIIGAVVFAQDITERKRVEEQTNQLQEYLQLQIERMPIGLITWDKEFRVKSWNPAAEKMFGFTQDEALGKHPYDFIVPKEVQPVVDDIWRRLLEGDKTAHSVNENVTKDGQNIICSWANTPLREAGGIVIGVLSMVQDITERKRAEEALRKSEAELKEAQRVGRLGNWDWDAPTDTITWSEEYYRIYGFNPKLSPPGYEEHKKAYTSESAKQLDAAVKHSMQTGESYQLDLELIREEGIRGWITARGEVKRDANGKIVGLRGTAQDITERKRAEEEIICINRTLRMLSETNQALIHIMDEATLLNEVCRIVVDVGGYRMAWVGFAEHDEAKTLRPVAHAGFESGYNESANVSWGNEERGQSPGGNAIHTGQPCIAHNIQLDPAFTHWREAAIQHGYKSIISLPLIREGKPFGVLCIYSGETDAFDTKEVDILNELAGDLAFGITALRTRTKRDEAEAMLRESEERYRSLFQGAAEGILVADIATQKFMYANPAQCRMLGYTNEELEQMSISDIHPATDLEWVMDEFMAQARGEKTVASSIPCLRKDGTMLYADINTTPMVINGKKYNVGFFSDITKRKHAEEALRSASLYVRSLIEASIDPLVTISPDGKITDLNQATELVTGVMRENLIGSDFSDYFTEPEKARIGYKQVLAQGMVRDYPLTIQHTSGKTTDVLYNATIYRNESGEMLGVFAAARDITERKRAEEKIVQLAAIVESSEDAIISKDLNGMITSWNKGAETIYGYTESEIIGKTISLLIPRELADEEMRILERVKMGEHIERYETVRQKKEGQRIDMSLTISPVQDMDGNVIGVSTIGHNITERKQAEENIRMLSRAMEQSPASIVITDLEGKIDYVNPKFTRLSGYTLDEVLGQNPRILKSDKKPSEDYNKLWETITSGNEWRGEFCNRKKNGELYWEAASISPVMNEAGSITHFIAVKEDITERKRTEAELITAKERAERSDKLKDAFIANISHEIRTPLNVILGYTSLVEDACSNQMSEEKQFFFDSIQSGAQRLMRTVDLILNISRLQSGEFTLNISRFNLSTVIEKLVHQLRYDAEKKSLELVYTNEFGPALMTADEYCLTEAMSNLINNGIKFTKRGSVNVRLYQNSSGEPCLDISDTGVGISDEYLPHLFEPYSQEETGYIRGYEGIGLGLALVKRYLDLHQIPISVESKKQSGTTFTLNFGTRISAATDSSFSPALKAKEKKQTVEAASRKQTRAKVLIVEDDPSTIGYLKIILRDRSDILIADNAEDAMSIVQSQSLDIILMDISIQGEKNGLDLTREIRSNERFKKLPIIAVTAHAFPYDRENSLRAGCNEYISKPMSKTKLFELIERYVIESRK